MAKDVFYPLRAFHGQMHEKRSEIENELRVIRTLKNTTPDTVFLVGTPVHPNIGDSAIALAELFFLQKHLPNTVPLVEITENMLKKHCRLAVQSIIRSEAPVFWHGGGNMGDLWPEQEIMRREVFEAIGQKRIIAFPQTIYYSDTEAGRKRAEASIPYYNGKAGLTLMAREQRSYEIMKELYPQTELLLIPDIVLSAHPKDFGVEPRQRAGVLMCLRNDKERNIQNSFWDQLTEKIEQYGEACRVTDMGAPVWVIRSDKRAKIIRKKLMEFSGAKMAVTDRLHGMVFAALTGTPCVVFTNNNHKVKSTYDWISYLPYIRFAESLDEAERMLPELLAMEDCKYDSTPLALYFEKLREIVLEACK